MVGRSHRLHLFVTRPAKYEYHYYFTFSSMIELVLSVSTLLVDKEVKFGCTDDDEYARRIEVFRYIKEMQDVKLWEMKRFLRENPDS